MPAGFQLPGCVPKTWSTVPHDVLPDSGLGLWVTLDSMPGPQGLGAGWRVLHLQPGLQYSEVHKRIVAALAHMVRSILCATPCPFWRCASRAQLSKHWSIAAEAPAVACVCDW